MQRTLLRAVTAAALILATTTATAAQGDPGPDPVRAAPGWTGTWKNSNNTMHIRAQRCGDDMCGTVIWADDDTKARIESKGRPLIGTQVFSGMSQTGPNQWSGKVFVPDLGKAVSGKVTLTDSESITAVGCLFGRVGCQTRHWQRIR